jgi:hypothetical protein
VMGNMGVEPPPPIIVTGVAFGQDQIQISYLEAKHQTADSSLDQTLVYGIEGRDARLVAEIQEALCEIIESYWISLRNPKPPDPESPTRNRFLDEDD